MKSIASNSGGMGEKGAIIPPGHEESQPLSGNGGHGGPSIPQEDELARKKRAFRAKGSPHLYRFAGASTVRRTSGLQVTESGFLTCGPQVHDLAWPLYGGVV